MYSEFVTPHENVLLTNQPNLNEKKKKNCQVNQILTQHIHSTINWHYYETPFGRQNTIKFVSDLHSHDLLNHRNFLNVK